LVVRRTGGALPGPCHWVRVPAETGQLYRLSGLAEMPGGEALTDFVHNLVPTAPGQEWMEIRDPARRVLRAAALRDGRLEAALFLAPDRARLPRAEAIIPLLGTLVPDAVRALLLAGRPPASFGDEGPQVCVCFGVGRDAVRHAVATDRLRSVADIGRHLRAGTNCGSCIPELEEILRDARVAVRVHPSPR
jgi:assimilatory nitrate reductase catalytic subunit